MYTARADSFFILENPNYLCPGGFFGPHSCFDNRLYLLIMFCLIALFLSYIWQICSCLPAAFSPYFKTVKYCGEIILIAVYITSFIPLRKTCFCSFSCKCFTVCVAAVRPNAVFNWMDGQWQRKHMMPPAGSSIVCRVPEPLSVLNKLDQPEPP